MHERAIIIIAKYLARTSTYVYLPDGNWQLSTSGVVYRTNIEKGIDCYVYAGFAVGWAQADSDDEENIILCMEYVITYTGCPVLWCSKLQT